ncbi:MAG: 5'-3' exonuclease H3TH domain-containing protein, partial [Stellaceae bacterium]
MDDAVALTSPQAESAADAAGAPRHVYLVDGSGFIFRAYHALPPLTRSDGTPTSAVLGFSNMLAKLLSETDADHIAVVFDHSGHSFRNRVYDQYKAQRPDAPADLVPQFRLVRDATDAFGVCRVELEDFEADDLIATYARAAAEAGAVVTIVSSDKDMMQLVGERVTMLDPIKNRQIGDAEVREKFGVGPDKVIEVQALCGDSVDNVPGVPGIGVKTAAELINAYGDLETLLDRAAEIKQPKRREALIVNADKARLSKTLVTLDTHAPMPCPLSELRVKPLDPDRLLPWLKDMEFRTLAARMAQRLSAGAATAEPPAPGEPAMPEIPPFSAPHSYALVDTLEGLDHWIAAAQQAGSLAIWPATSTVPGCRPALAGIALALMPGMAAYVPLGHRPPGNGQVSLDLGGQEQAAAVAPARSNALSLDDALARLKPLFEDKSVLKVVPDAKAAAHLLLRHGIALAPYDCTMLMSYVLDGGQIEHAIEPLTQRCFEHALTSAKELLGT